jgi:hypothetical protein
MSTETPNRFTAYFQDRSHVQLVCGVAIVALGALVADYVGTTDSASARPPVSVVGAPAATTK